MLSVILCSIGRRVELTRCFVDSVRRLAPAGSRVIGLDIDPLAPALAFVDQAVLVPRAASPEFLTTMRTLVDECRGHAVLVVPLSDREIAPLAQLGEQMGRPEVFFSVIPTSAIEIVEDKWATMGFFRSIGLQTPASWLPGAESSSFEYPVFIKPRRGSAGEGGAIARNRQWADLILSETEQPIIQQLMTGDEITTDVVVSLGGEFLTCISRRRLQIRGGEVTKSITVRIPTLEEACRAIVRHLRPRGPITVQAFESTSGDYQFSEINARLGGGSPLSIASGIPITDLMVMEALGCALPDRLDHVEDVSMTRFDDSLFFSRRELDALSYRDLRPG